MTQRYEILGKQKFTDSGRVGVWLFLLSPAVSALGYAWLASELSSRFSPNVAGPALVMMLGGYLFLSGCILMLIGREQRFDVRSVQVSSQASPDDSRAEDPWPSPLGPRLDHKWK